MDEPRRGANPGTAPRPAGPGASDEIDLLEYWRILVERRRVVVGTLVATLAVVLLFTVLSTPLYRAATIIQIERRGPEVLTFKDVMDADAGGVQGYQDFYQTQYRILESETVLTRAVRDLDLHHDPEFLARKRPPIRRLIRWGRSWFGDLPESDPLERAVDFVSEGLAIQPVRNSHLVRVAFEDRNPDLAADVANAVADAYRGFIQEARFETSDEASRFLTRQALALQSEITGLQRELQEYGADKELLELGEGSRDISEQALTELNASLARARVRLTEAHARYQATREADPSTLEAVIESPLIGRLKEQHAELERRHRQMSERFKPDWPALEQVASELEQARQRLDVEARSLAEQIVGDARNAFEQARAEVENLQHEVDTLRARVQQVNQDRIEYANILAQIENRRRVLDTLVARQSETRASGELSQTGSSNVRVVDRAKIPEEPSSPRKGLNLVLGFILGGALGVGLAFVRHFLDNTVKTEHDVQRFAPGVAILGHLPMYQPLRAVGTDRTVGPPGEESGPDLATHMDPRSAFSESFKSLRTSLLLASPDHPPRSIVVTSCEPGDGKSTIAINLATVLAQMGRRVLLIDADLRRPRIHRGLDLDNAAGLSSYLTGNAGLDDLVADTVVDGFRAIPSGPIPPNPSELLESDGLDRLLAELTAGAYDHVIIDSPPAVQVADGMILAKRMDATVLVVRAGISRRESLVQAVRRLRHARAHLTGVVVNAVPESNGYYYRQYYRQGYHLDNDAEAAAQPLLPSVRVRLGRRKQRDRKRA